MVKDNIFGILCDEMKVVCKNDKGMLSLRHLNPFLDMVDLYKCNGNYKLSIDF